MSSSDHRSRDHSRGRPLESNYPYPRTQVPYDQSSEVEVVFTIANSKVFWDEYSIYNLLTHVENPSSGELLRFIACRSVPYYTVSRVDQSVAFSFFHAHARAPPRNQDIVLCGHSAAVERCFEQLERLCSANPVMGTLTRTQSNRRTGFALNNQCVIKRTNEVTYNASGAGAGAGVTIGTTGRNAAATAAATAGTGKPFVACSGLDFVSSPDAAYAIFSQFGMITKMFVSAEKGTLVMEYTTPAAAAVAAAALDTLANINAEQVTEAPTTSQITAFGRNIEVKHIIDVPSTAARNPAWQRERGHVRPARVFTLNVVIPEQDFTACWPEHLVQAITGQHAAGRRVSVHFDSPEHACEAIATYRGETVPEIGAAERAAAGAARPAPTSTLVEIGDVEKNIDDVNFEQMVQEVPEMKEMEETEKIEKVEEAQEEAQEMVEEVEEAQEMAAELVNEAVDDLMEEPSF